MEIGDHVEVKEAIGAGTWRWEDRNGRIRKGHVTEIDKHCLTVCTDDGEIIRDVRDHFRPPRR